MKTRILALSFGFGILAAAAQANLLVNGDLDKTYQQEIVAGFFLPKPKDWKNDGMKGANAYEDEMSSEPWSGPAPTPVTTNSNGGGDNGVFFKPFTGTANEMASGHLYQDVAGTAGLRYSLSGWAGAEANAMMEDAVFALEFIDGGGNIIGSSILSLMSDLKTPNGAAFNYKKYTVHGSAPAGTSKVRARASMINAMSNPAGGGQAFVVDDFELTAVPEPTTMVLMASGLAAIAARRRKS